MCYITSPQTLGTHKVAKGDDWRPPTVLAGLVTVLGVKRPRSPTKGPFLTKTWLNIAPEPGRD